MRPKGILIIALRIGAIIIVVNALDKFPLLLGYYKTETGVSGSAFITMSLIPLFISFLIAGLMWFVPDFLLNKVFVRDNSEARNVVSDAELGHLFIALIGLYILATAIADMVYHVGLVNESKKQIGNSFEMLPSDYASFIATIAETIIGALLIFGSKPIFYLMSRFKKEIKGSSL
jgi:hypothetical protein